MQTTCLGLGLVAGLVAACGSSTASSTTGAGTMTAVIADLAPTGQLRVGIPASPPVLATKDPATGELHGIAVDLGTALAQRLSVAFTPVIYPTPPQVLAALQSGAVDVAVLPAMPETTRVVPLTAPFLAIPHTLMVRDGSPFRTVADVDHAGVRIASEKGSGHTKVLATVLKQAQLIQADSEAAALQLLTSGAADAYASGRFALLDDLKTLTGYHLLDDDFFVARQAMAVAPSKHAGFNFLTSFVEQAKASGTVQQAIAKTGAAGLDVPPAGTPAASG
jgi:polar amino acid transport system substrate-binding protein